MYDSLLPSTSLPDDVVLGQTRHHGKTRQNAITFSKKRCLGPGIEMWLQCKACMTKWLFWKRWQIFLRTIRAKYRGPKPRSNCAASDSCLLSAGLSSVFTIILHNIGAVCPYSFLKSFPKVHPLWFSYHIHMVSKILVVYFQIGE